MGNNFNTGTSLNNEYDLWLAFIHGDEHAFSELYKKCYRDLYSYGISLGMDEHQAVDAIQDIFLKIYLKSIKIKNAETVRPFLFQSIKNAYLNLLKREQKHISLENLTYDFSFKYTIEDRLINKEDREAVKQKIDKALSTLTSRQKEIIYLRFLHEMEFEEIAVILNISEQAARNLLHRAFEKIRKNANTLDVIILYLIFCTLK